MPDTTPAIVRPPLPRRRVTHAMGDDLTAMCGPTVPDETGRIVLTVTPAEVTCPKCRDLNRSCSRCGWETDDGACPQCGADPDAAAV